MAGLRSGHQAKVRFYTVPLAIGCSILSVFGARSSVLLIQRPVLAEKRLAEVGQVVSQGAP